MYAFWETNPMVHSKLLMDDVWGIRNILLGQEGSVRNIIRDNVYLSQFEVLATEECDISNCMYFWRQIQWCI